MKAFVPIGILIISITIFSCIAIFFALSIYSQNASEKGKEEMKELISGSNIIIETASNNYVAIRNKGTSKIYTGGAY
ncbi:MAG: hypothetical protein N3D84_03455, partial [Candidatus Woesearchaeota archaeon]|nr:hypothetical protein [Candidatus Woesearchaeota archaeon]